MHWVRSGVMVAGVWLLNSFLLQAAELPAAAVAEQVDQLLIEELELPADTLQAMADDEIFLRRASLDLVGRLPSPEQMAAFVLDPSPDKRAKMVETLLDDPEYGKNWGRYWRDVVLYRRLEDRAIIVSRAAEEYLTEQFNANAPWDEIATDLITARGDVRADGETVLLMAQDAQPAETAAEVSRIFMGIQIQCAQCHDHPTDRWKREQFHQLAAFFPRTVVRIVRDQQRRTFEVASRDRGPIFGPRGGLEYFMPDLEDPQSRGKLIQPQLFLNAKYVKVGSDDSQRREALAEWITAADNPWFAKAFINRVWTELVGSGFYQQIDDLGPERTCSAPKTLDYLAEQFIAHDYDVKWLFRTITATRTYQQRINHNELLSDSPADNSDLKRLRGDQLFNNLTQALGIAEPEQQRGGRYVPPFASPRGQFNQTFGYDPSSPKGDVVGSVPQALALMNSPILQSAINARSPQTTLGRLVRNIEDDEELIVELYLRCLAREPSDRELKVAQDYVNKVTNRAEAYEDLLWSLINSTEFLHRR